MHTFGIILGTFVFLVTLAFFGDAAVAALRDIRRQNVVYDDIAGRPIPVWRTARQAYRAVTGKNPPGHTTEAFLHNLDEGSGSSGRT